MDAPLRTLHLHVHIRRRVGLDRQRLVGRASDLTVGIGDDQSDL